LDASGTRKRRPGWRATATVAEPGAAVAAARSCHARPQKDDPMSKLDRSERGEAWKRIGAAAGKFHVMLEDRSRRELGKLKT
jgi:hypothetical protein